MNKKFATYAQTQIMQILHATVLIWFTINLQEIGAVQSPAYYYIYTLQFSLDNPFISSWCNHSSVSTLIRQEVHNTGFHVPPWTGIPNLHLQLCTSKSDSVFQFPLMAFTWQINTC